MFLRWSRIKDTETVWFDSDNDYFHLLLFHFSYLIPSCKMAANTVWGFLFDHPKGSSVNPAWISYLMPDPVCDTRNVPFLTTLSSRTSIHINQHLMQLYFYSLWLCFCYFLQQCRSVDTHRSAVWRNPKSQIPLHISAVITSLSAQQNAAFFALQALFKLFYNQLHPAAPCALRHSLLISRFKDFHNIHVHFTMCMCARTYVCQVLSTQPTLRWTWVQTSLKNWNTEAESLPWKY